MDGRGLSGIAPALNSPHFFGFDFLAPVNAEIAQLNAEREAEGTTSARIAEIDARLVELDTQRNQLLAQMQTAIDRGYNPEQPSRLEQLGWGASRTAFVFTTLVHGRPTSVSYWPRPMPAWAQAGGGPLRTDQLNDLVNYILNFDKGSNWTLDDLLAVNQFPKIPGEGGVAAPENAAGTDVQAIVAAITEAPGDPVEGQAIYNDTAVGCAGCHAGGIVGPPTEGTYTRVVEIRLQDPALQGYTPEQYLVESIVDPHVYLVPSYGPVMPDYFGERLAVEDIADLVAFLESQDQPIQ